MHGLGLRAGYEGIQGGDLRLLSPGIYLCLGLQLG